MAEDLKGDPGTNFKKVDNFDFYSKFCYPLLHSERQEIRLLHINACGPNHHKLVSNLSLLDNPAYTALSYVCGSPTDTASISVNGLNFIAFANLARAIADVSYCWEKQHPGQDLFLWTDQVCINQNDNDERSSQVSFMREIYTHANHVVVWLGLPRDEYKHFQSWEAVKEWFDIQLLKVSSFLKAPAWEMEWSDINWLDLEPNAESVIIKDFPLTSASRLWVKEMVFAWKKAQRIVASPWWKRLWIYQEFIANSQTSVLVGHHLAPWQDLDTLLKKCNRSQTVWTQWHNLLNDRIESLMTDGHRHLDAAGEPLECGPACLFCIPGENIRHAFMAMNNHGGLCPESFESLLPPHERDGGNLNCPSDMPDLSDALFVCDSKSKTSNKGSQYHLPLATLLDHASACSVLEPRDRVYAILGLAAPQYRRIPIDYAAPLADLLVNVAQVLVREDRSLYILSVRQREITKCLQVVENLPSWAPTWNTIANSLTYSPSRYDSNIHSERQQSWLDRFSSRPCMATFHPDDDGVAGRLLQVRGVLLDVILDDIDQTHSTSLEAFMSGKHLIYNCRGARYGDEVWAIFGLDDLYLLRKQTLGYKLVGGTLYMEEGLPPLAERFADVLSQDINAVAQDILIGSEQRTTLDDRIKLHDRTDTGSPIQNTALLCLPHCQPKRKDPRNHHEERKDNHDHSIALIQQSYLPSHSPHIPKLYLGGHLPIGKKATVELSTASYELDNARVLPAEERSAPSRHLSAQSGTSFHGADQQLSSRELCTYVSDCVIAIEKEYGAHGEARQLFEAEKDHAGLIFLDQGTHHFTLQNGALLTVYASPYTPALGAWGFQYHPKNRGHDFSIGPDINVNLAMTHGPPKGIMDYTYGGERAGCPDLFAAVARARPQLHCFGHIHEGWGAKLGLGGGTNRTLFVNASVSGAEDLPVQKPWRVDIELPKAPAGDLMALPVKEEMQKEEKQKLGQKDFDEDESTRPAKRRRETKMD